MRPARFSVAASWRHHERRGDAVLVAHDVGHRVAERLLVGEQQPVLRRLGDRAHHPLEAGERLGVAGAGGLGHAPEQRRGGDRGDEQRAPRVLAVLEQEVGEQRADLVPVQAAPAVRARDRDGEAVGVGVVGEHHVGVVRRRRGQREVERARLLGVGARRRSGSRDRAPPAPRRRAAPGSRRGRAPRGTAARRRRAAACRRSGRRARRRRGARRGWPPGSPRRRPPARRRRRAAASTGAPTRSIAAAICSSAGGAIWAPSPR